MTDKILAARALLERLTPLKSDCGIYCGGACCASESDDERGMLLFPGEEELYLGCDFAKIEPAEFYGIPHAKILVCEGDCPRDMRPLCCRIFPIAPQQKASGFGVRLDRRAFAVCPLCGYGASAFDKDFVNACREAFNLLAMDKYCRAYLVAWSALMDEYARGL